MLLTSSIVDTNVLSELTKKAPDPGVLEWAQQIRRVAVSVATIEEVYFGLSWKPNPRILRWFEEFLEIHCEILPVTGGIAKRAGEIRGQLQARGQTRTTWDMVIAMTAQEHHLTVVTRNVDHFEGCGVPILNPFRYPLQSVSTRPKPAEEPGPAGG